jgi:hypothetical protein
VGREFSRHFLGEDASLGSQQNDRAGSPACPGGQARERSRRSEHAFDRLEDRFDFHDHAAASGVRFVVGDVVAIVSPIANVVHMHVNQPALMGAMEDATFQVGGEYFG